MIHSYDKWRLLESFGNGEETFTDELIKYASKGKRSNLDIEFFPEVWGELEDAKGKIEYLAELDMNSFGIEDITFSINSISVEFEVRVYKKPPTGAKFGLNDVDDEGELKTIEFSITREQMGTDPKIKVGKLPLYLEQLVIDFKDAVDKEGKLDHKKVKFELEFGQ